MGAVTILQDTRAQLAVTAGTIVIHQAYLTTKCFQKTMIPEQQQARQEVAGKSVGMIKAPETALHIAHALSYTHPDYKDITHTPIF